MIKKGEQEIWIVTVAMEITGAMKMRTGMAKKVISYTCF